MEEGVCSAIHFFCLFSQIRLLCFVHYCLEWTRTCMMNNEWWWSGLGLDVHNILGVYYVDEQIHKKKIKQVNTFPFHTLCFANKDDEADKARRQGRQPCKNLFLALSLSSFFCVFLLFTLCYPLSTMLDDGGDVWQLKGITLLKMLTIAWYDGIARKMLMMAIKIVWLAWIL